MERLYIDHYWRAVNYAFQFLRDSELSREIAQEAFMSLWLKRESLDPEKNVEYYLMSTVRNKVFNHIRDKKRRAERMGEQLEINDRLNLIALSELASEKVLYQEALSIFRTARKTLPPKILETFLLCRDQELTYKEIAEKQGISVKTVEYRIGKALAILKEALAEYLYILLPLFLLKFIG